MPGGLAFDSTQSYVAFAAIKFVGYSIAGAYLSKRYPVSKTNPLLFGVTRTLIGMMFGALVGLLGFWALNLAVYLFLIFLIPVRILEWWVILKLFYSKAFKGKYDLSNNIALGTVWSFVLDIPAIFGFIVTGGFWIC